MPDFTRFISLAKRIVLAVAASIRDAAGGLREKQIGEKAVPVVATLVALLLLGVSIALVVHTASPAAEVSEFPSPDRPDIVRPVRLRDFRFPELQLYGPRGEFFRYRDSEAPWTEEEIERLRVDTESEAVDTVSEKNRELLRELLNM